ncbi:MAG: LysE family translocator [Rhodospirillales bacterium]|nr:LysE family translocator [Rhodospirillales bacterium]MDE2573934.1 LysE family translocator [Rhodospirillales bacterium]
MPELHLYLGFLLASTVLFLIPGPNVALIVANSVAYGTRYGLLTMAGTASAMVVQLAVTAAGMAALLGAMAGWFEVVRWIGVAYLLWLGLRQWRAPAGDLSLVRAQPRSPAGIFLRGLLVSLTNPKTLFFYGAFFPQFIVPGPELGRQVAVLAASFLGLALLVDGSWAVLAGHVRGALATRGRLRNRLSGGLLIGAGVGLALARHR